SLDAVAAHGRQHARGLLAAHHADARVRPHPQEAGAIGAAAHGVVAGAEAAADHHGELGHARTRHRRDHLRSALGHPRILVLRPTMKPVMFCRNTSGIPRWLHSSMKCAPLSALSENRMPLLATMPTG